MIEKMAEHISGSAHEGAAGFLRLTLLPFLR